MRFMNRWDIDHAVEFAQRTPEFLPYVLFLRDWRDVVDANSDGWPYWSPAVKAAEKLIVQVERLVVYLRQGGGIWRLSHEPVKPEVEAFRKALVPIKSFATRHKLEAPVLEPVVR